MYSNGFKVEAFEADAFEEPSFNLVTVLAEFSGDVLVEESVVVTVLALFEGNVDVEVVEVFEVVKVDVDDVVHEDVIVDDVSVLVVTEIVKWDEFSLSLIWSKTFLLDSSCAWALEVAVLITELIVVLGFFAQISKEFSSFGRFKISLVASSTVLRISLIEDKSFELIAEFLVLGSK